MFLIFENCCEIIYAALSVASIEFVAIIVGSTIEHSIATPASIDAQRTKMAHPEARETCDILALAFVFKIIAISMSITPPMERNATITIAMKFFRVALFPVTAEQRT